MQFNCIKKKSELDAKKKKEAKASKKSSASSQRTPSSERKQETPVYNEYKKSSPSLKNISIKKATSEEEEEKTEEDISNRPTQIFSDDELKTAWLRYADNNKESLPRMYQVFQNHIPKKGDGNELFLLLDNDSQRKDFLERILSNVMGFLKDELNNYSINLSVKVSDEIESKNLIYTATDKYKFLSEINPELEELKRKFSLDFE